MKYTIIMLLMAVATITTAQDNAALDKYIINEIQSEVDGIYKEYPSEDGSVIHAIQVPGYYNEELVILSVKVFVEKHSDISFRKNWNRKDKGAIDCIFRIDKTRRNYILSYNDGIKYLFIVAFDHD